MNVDSRSQSGGNAGVRLAYDRGTLVLSGVGNDRPPAAFPRDFWAWDARLPAWRCEAIRYREAAALERIRATVAEPPSLLRRSSRYGCEGRMHADERR
jgi:hypothetical protein